MLPPVSEKSWRTTKRAYPTTAIGLLIALGGFCFVHAQTKEIQTPTDTGATSSPVLAQYATTSRDEVLWGEILEASRASLDSEPYRSDSRKATDSRRFLLNKVRLYLRLYPGGLHRDEAIRLELTALFEIGVLSNGAFAPVRAQVDQYMKTKPSRAAVEEAAFWKIQCDRIEHENAASQPTSSPVTAGCSALFSAYREYIDTYPRARHVPKLAAELFYAALDSGDVSEQRRVVARLEHDFPQHLITKTLAAQLRRIDAIGKPFSITFRTIDGDEIDTSSWIGAPVLIVVWGGFSEDCRTSVRKIEGFRAAHPDFHVIGINLDESVNRMNAACHELSLCWPQYHDGMGWSCEFARRWGVRKIPRIFLIDRSGLLVDVRGGEDWQEAAKGL